MEFVEGLVVACLWTDHWVPCGPEVTGSQPVCPVRVCIPRKQEELVQQVRKRLEEALMADMLAHVEELARDGDAPLDKACTEDDEDEDEEDDEPEPERV